MTNSSTEFAEMHWLMDVLQSIDIGLVILDRDYKIQLWNGFMENHSGLRPDQVHDKPLFESFNDTQTKQLQVVQDYLESEGIEYIRCSSKGRLSKYYGEEHGNKYSMKVARKTLGNSKTEYFDINKATDLFTKFAEAHSINRLHCNTDLLSESQMAKIAELTRQ